MPLTRCLEMMSAGAAAGAGPIPASQFSSACNQLVQAEATADSALAGQLLGIVSDKDRKPIPDPGAITKPAALPAGAVEDGGAPTGDTAIRQEAYVFYQCLHEALTNGGGADSQYCVGVPDAAGAAHNIFRGRRWAPGQPAVIVAARAVPVSDPPFGPIVGVPKVGSEREACGAQLRLLPSGQLLRGSDARSCPPWD